MHARSRRVRGRTFAAGSLVGLLLLATDARAAEISWVNQAGGAWNVGNNWSTGVVPGASDTARIEMSGTYTVRLEGDVSVRSLLVGATEGVQTLRGTGHALTIGQSAEVKGGGLLRPGVLAGQGTVTNRGTIELAGGSRVDAGVVNYGRIDVTDSTAVNGAVTAEAGGAIRILGGASFIRFARGFTNRGLIQAAASAEAALTVAEGDLTVAQNGAIEATTAGQTIVTVEQGLLSVDEGGRIDVQGSGALRLRAALDNEGEVESTGGALVIETAASHDNKGVLRASGGDVTVDLSAGGSWTNRGTIDVSGGRAFSVAGTFAAESGSRLVFSGSGGACVFSQGFTNRGTIEAQATDGATVRLAQGTLTNAEGAVIRATGAGTLVLDARLDNQGEATAGAGSLVLRGSSAAHVNTGTFRATGGDLRLDLAPGGATFANEGTIEVSNGRSVSVQGTITAGAGSRIRYIEGGGSVLLSESFTNAGRIEATTPADARFSVALGTLVNAAGGVIEASGGGEFRVEAALDNRSDVRSSRGRFLIARDGAAHANIGAISAAGGDVAITGAGTSFANTGVLEASGDAAIDVEGSFTTGAGSRIRITGQGGALRLVKGFTNRGHIEVSASGRATVTVSTGTFTNAAGALIRTDGRGELVLDADLDNSGEIACAGGRLVFRGRAAQHINAGLVAATGGDLVFEALVPGAHLTNRGSLEVAGSRSFTVSGGFTSEAQSRIRITGVGGTLAFSSGFTNKGTIESSASGDARIRVAGSLVNDPAAVIEAGGNGRTVLETRIENGGTLACTSGGLFIAADGAEHLNTGTVTADGEEIAFNLSGLVARLTNRGTIRIGGNSRVTVNGGQFENILTGSVEGSGTLALLGTVFVNQSPVAASVSVVLGEANRVPATTRTVAGVTLRDASDRYELDLRTVFADPDGDSLAYRVTSSDTLVAAGWVIGGWLTVTPVATAGVKGSTRITLVADDGKGGSASTTVTVSLRLIREDFDEDGQVAFSDFVLFARAFQTSDTRFDLDANGEVAFSDFVLFAQSFGSTIASSGSAGAGKPARAGGAVELAMRPSQDGTDLQVAVYVTGAGEVSGYGLEVDFDPASVAFVTAESPVPSVFSVGTNGTPTLLCVQRRPGHLILADVAREPLQGRVEIARLTFRAVGGGTGGRVDVRRALVADGALDIREVAGGSLVLAHPPRPGIALAQNVPNPFNPQTEIAYGLSEPGDVVLEVYNPLGQLVRTLVRSRHETGNYLATWDGRDDLGRSVASGVYFYRLSGQGLTMARRMLLLK